MAATQRQFRLGSLFVALIVGLAACSTASDTAGGSDLSPLEEFEDLVVSGAPCAVLFDRRNEVRRQDQSLSPALAERLRRIGCSGSDSERADTAPQPLVEGPVQACARTFAESAGDSIDHSIVWAPQVEAGPNRRVLWRLDQNWSEATFCDVEYVGEYQSPTETTVYSIFTMKTLGSAPNEELPPAEAILEEANSQR